MFIVRYKVRPVQPGKPLGELLLSDQKTYAVWNESLHRQCLALPAETPVSIKFQKSKSNHVYLTAIESTRSDAERYDDARQRDEATMTGRSTPGRYVRDMLSKAVQRHVDADRNGHAGEMPPKGAA